MTSGEGARFPAVPFNATIWNAGDIPTPLNSEIVRVTARSTDTLTITRAQEGSTARSVIVGDLIAATVTAKTLTDIETAAVPVLRLDYTAATDVMNAAAITANTWTDVNSDQSFTVTGTGSLLQLSVRGCCNISSVSASNQVGSRLLIDGATAYRLGGSLNTAANEFCNALDGSSPVTITGLSAGSHTVRVQVFTSQTSTGYCRPSAQPTFENLSIQVLEHKA